MSNGWHTGGDFSSLPKRTTLHGQDHMLSYITPEEAAMLRQQGGGVTPTGGQYRGPGGVPAFTLVLLVATVEVMLLQEDMVLGEGPPEDMLEGQQG